MTIRCLTVLSSACSLCESMLGSCNFNTSRLIFGKGNENKESCNEQRNDRQNTKLCVAGQSCRESHNGRANNRRKFAENIIEAKEFIGLILRDNLGVIGPTQCLNTALSGSDHG